jgi:uncharacterized protein YndB with AHSA1/START domain
MQTETHGLEFERTYNATPARVREAWTNPETLGKWFAPGPLTCRVTTLDVRVGGQFEFTMVGEDGEYTASGTYETVTDDELGMTWAWSHEPASISKITVQFHTDGDGCRMVFKHHGFASKEAADHHLEGWEGCLAKLQAVLA